VKVLVLVKVVNQAKCSGSTLGYPRAPKTHEKRTESPIEPSTAGVLSGHALPQLAHHGGRGCRRPASRKPATRAMLYLAAIQASARSCRRRGSP
jgi:hypothetical protein